MVNATANMADTYFPKDLDVLVAQVRALSHVCALKLRDWSADIPNAYKKISMRESPKKSAAICFVNPPNNVPYKAQIAVQPFGS